MKRKVIVNAKGKITSSEATCKLWYDEMTELYMTDCEAQYPYDIDPEDGAFDYCPFCGSKITWGSVLEDLFKKTIN